MIHGKIVGIDMVTAVSRLPGKVGCQEKGVKDKSDGVIQLT